MPRPISWITWVETRWRTITTDSLSHLRSVIDTCNKHHTQHKWVELIVGVNKDLHQEVVLTWLMCRPIHFGSHFRVKVSGFTSSDGTPNTFGTRLLLVPVQSAWAWFSLGNIVNTHFFQLSGTQGVNTKQEKECHRCCHGNLIKSLPCSQFFSGWEVFLRAIQVSSQSVLL